MRQPSQQTELAAVGRLGVQADQGHEDRDQGQGQHDRHGGGQVGRQHPSQHDGGHEGRQHELREVAREVGVQRVEPSGDQRGHRPGVRPTTGAERREVGQQASPQFALHRGRRVGGSRFLRPGDGGPGGDHGSECDQCRGQGARVSAVEKDGGDAVGQEGGLGDDQRGESHAERHRGGEVGAGAAGVAQQARVEGLHTGIRSTVRRLRNTQ